MLVPFERLVSSVASACGRCAAAHYAVMWCLSYWLDWWKLLSCWSVCIVQEMERAFLAEVKKGDLPKVKKLIGKGCPANAKDEVR